MTKEELSLFDGQKGRKAYVAVNGKVFEVTASPYWQAGNHQNVHQAGKDLTAELLNAPHVRSVIERFPVVAELEEFPQEKPKSWGDKTVFSIVVVLAVSLFVWLLLR